MKKLIDKVNHSKLMLYIIPSFVYCFFYLFIYNNNFDYYITRCEVLLYECLIMIGVFFLLYTFAYLFLKLALKDNHKVFCMSFIVILFSFYKFTFVTFIVWLIFFLILVIVMKKFINLKLDNLVGCLSIVFIILFCSQFPLTIYNVFYSFINTRSFDYDIEFKIDSTTKRPNIYWIHCDGMLNFSALEKYYDYDNNELKQYFDNSGFVYDDDTLLIAGHRTQSSLVAMFNPYYYDNFFGGYLSELEKSFIEERQSSFIVDYYELERKRINNELLKALKEKGYSTVAIADFNQYTGMFTDYFYDFYNKYKSNNYSNEFRYIDLNSQDSRKMLTYIRFNHAQSLLSSASFFPLLRDINYLDYSVLDYESNDIIDYYYTNNSEYWISKAILAGINDVSKIENEKFVFIDFKLNHFPILFDANGNYLVEDVRNNPDYYAGNYIYSTKLLSEMLSYIKAKDENAVIFVQSDHGIHVFKDAILRNHFDISQTELQDMRNSVISAYYIPEEYKTGDESYLSNPLNISRYIVNNYVGYNYEYID